MTRYLFALLCIVTLSFSQQHKHVSYEKAYPLLQQIDDKAILLGEGEKDVYVFIDPLCRYSRKFLKNVLSHEMMLKKYRYHLFMYEIPRLHSQALIYAIYHQKKKRQSLIYVMVENGNLKTEESRYPEETETVQAIADVARQLGVFKRPFIIVSQKRE